jgi:hypothetical protein
MGKRVQREMDTISVDADATVEQPQSKKAKKGSVGGPHFTMKNKKVAVVTDQEGNFWPQVRNDDWATCKESWAAIAPYLEQYKNKKVWQPFYYDGQCAEHLREIGFKNVTHEKMDFFAKCNDEEFLKKVDLIWDNPPYTGEGMKERVLTAAVSTRKPFLLLLPSSIVFSNVLREVLSEEEQKHIQVIAQRRVMVTKAGDTQSPIPFKYLVWLGYKVGLERDFIIV